MSSPPIVRLLNALGAPYGREAAQLVREFATEASEAKRKRVPDRMHLRLKSAEPLLSVASELRGKIVLTALRLIDPANSSAGEINPYWVPHESLRQIIARLLRSREPFEEEDLTAIVDLIIPSRWDYRGPAEQRADVVLQAVENRIAANGLGRRLRAALEALLHRMQARAELERKHYLDLMKEDPGWQVTTFLAAAERRFVSRIEAILENRQNDILQDDGSWEEEANNWLAGRSEKLRSRWNELFAHMKTGAAQRVPSAKWCKKTADLVHRLGADRFSKTLVRWLEWFDPEKHWTWRGQPILRGLILAAAAAELEDMAEAIGRFGERCYKKISGVGPGSIKLGNACMTALASMPGPHGAAQLSRLKQKVRYTSGTQILDRSLTSAANRAGVTVDELEERSVPDFGLGAAGRHQENFDGYVGAVDINSGKAVFEWRGREGKLLKQPPVSVREAGAARIKALKRIGKDVSDLILAQERRVESLYLQARHWAFADWRRCYLDHPIVGAVAKRLIWQFETDGRARNGLFRRGAIRDGAGREIGPSDRSMVRLWHPIDASVDEVTEWRRVLEAEEIDQPFKQAFREIYVLTDAERQTSTYSNRFAAHILRQHQFTHLCRQRGWRYGLQGRWDSHKVPTRHIAAIGLDAQFWVESVRQEGDEGVAGFGLVASDQTRFYASGNEPRPLAAIPRIIFSEIMRDVDLFVSVCSVGNDPTWFDGGPQGQFRDYWDSYAFGPLIETAKTRRQALESLLPRLKIAGQCRLDERDLIVEGRLRTYKIHVGSANVRMAPNDQYLCIVFDRGKRSNNAAIRLPFEGDQTLSLILSKAFMLAEDDKIRDPSILSQINRAAA